MGREQRQIGFLTTKYTNDTKKSHPLRAVHGTLQLKKKLEGYDSKLNAYERDAR